ncbi:hypothetical protein [Robertmurraya kyonggiensis]|uniref:Uncharacterized protein n=1 Tax=Robertmurraya kyonggiensis TaxID=1037680 RepID=A0A4U1D6T2_9BACI|nr:hypothetical protein [Robertmurraya kyonggiensis]TKC18272.1 hypothetical protein FA727_01575 [Robertmurraya kyonggiensis]
MEKDNKPYQDPISKFMFGERFDEKEDDTVPVEQEERDWLFGKRTSRTKSSEENPINQIPFIGERLQNIDYMEMMQHFDTLMTSANDLKPLFKKIKPVLLEFLQKK